MVWDFLAEHWLALAVVYVVGAAVTLYVNLHDMVYMSRPLAVLRNVVLWPVFLWVLLDLLDIVVVVLLPFGLVGGLALTMGASIGLAVVLGFAAASFVVWLYVAMGPGV